MRYQDIAGSTTSAMWAVHRAFQEYSNKIIDYVVHRTFQYCPNKYISLANVVLPRQWPVSNNPTSNPARVPSFS